jgi:hypothetical protein
LGAYKAIYAGFLFSDVKGFQNLQQVDELLEVVY